MSWQRWGDTPLDPGLDLSVAAGWLDGRLPYRDVRYWYGPLGLSVLTGVFAVFGISLTTAFAYGLLQTAVIAELTRRLAGRWLPGPLTAATVAVVLAIGFSGSLFNYQLPHTVAATTGIITLLALLLALSHGRGWIAGFALGALALTRPEFLAFGLAAVAGAALGLVPSAGWRAAARYVLKMVPGAVLVAGSVLGYFAAKAGAHRVLFENIIPLEFARAVGPSFEATWHPYDLPSLGSLLLRGVIVAGGALAVLRMIEAVAFTGGGAASRGRRLRIVAGPLLSFAAAVLLTVVLATVLAAIGGRTAEPINDVGRDIGRLLIPMTALPAIAFAALLVAAVAWWRRDRTSPLDGPSWSADGALVAVAAACSLRAYGAFSTDSYATYYALPVVILAAVLLQRAGARLASHRTVAVGSILAAAAGVLTIHAVVGRYVDFKTPITSERGTYRESAAAPAIQGIIDLLGPRLRADEPMLVVPHAPGLYFLLNTRPALYDSTFLPGTLPTRVSDEAAARRLIVGPAPGAAPGDVYRPPRYVVEAVSNLSPWGFRGNGIDVNVALMRAVHENYSVFATFGDPATPEPAGNPSTTYVVYQFNPVRPR